MCGCYEVKRKLVAITTARFYCLLLKYEGQYMLVCEKNDGTQYQRKFRNKDDLGFYISRKFLQEHGELFIYLKIPKKLEDFNGAENSIEDKVAVKQAIATAENKRFNKKEIEERVENDNELEQVNKLPFNANDLMVITVVKKLAAYILAFTFSLVY